MSRPTLAHIQPSNKYWGLFPWRQCDWEALLPEMGQLGHGDCSSPSSGAETENAWSCASTPPCFFVVWCLAGHRSYFTFTLTLTNPEFSGWFLTSAVDIASLIKNWTMMLLLGSCMWWIGACHRVNWNVWNNYNGNMSKKNKVEGFWEQTG